MTTVLLYGLSGCLNANPVRLCIDYNYDHCIAVWTIRLSGSKSCKTMYRLINLCTVLWTIRLTANPVRLCVDYVTTVLLHGLFVWQQTLYRLYDHYVVA